MTYGYWAVPRATGRTGNTGGPYSIVLRLSSAKGASGMQRVLLVGAGKIGGTIAAFLSRSGDYDVLVADADEASLRRISDSLGVETVKLNADDPVALHKAASGRNVVVSATSFAFNPAIAAVALG